MNRISLLYVNVFIIATCGLVYELLAGTLASYVLGDSVTQFSFCIGIYLSALGVGAWLSGFIPERSLAGCFIEVEFGVALLGGCAASLLFLSFAYLDWFELVLYGLVFAIGVLVGLELPLLMRILKTQVEFKDLVSRVLAFDYVGALVASLLFPIFLVPRLGLVRTSFLFGLLNAAVGLWGTWLLASLGGRNMVFLRFRGVLVILLLLAGLVKADWFTEFSEDQMYADPVVYSKTSRYQRIIVTRSESGFQLYLNGNLQFNSLDEYRYHEALVHPALMYAAEPERVLVLGGGDGLALREVLKAPQVRAVTLVDLDPEMTALSERYGSLKELNNAAFDDPRVTVVNQDAFVWLEHNRDIFDAVVIDFPDPSNFALGKLYSRRFFRMLRASLSADGAVTIQATSPLFAQHAYWCVVRTMEASGFVVRPYHVPVPSFGIWGFALATTQDVPAQRAPVPGLKYLTPDVLETLFVFPTDLARVETDVNRLDNQVLVRYHNEGWSEWK